MTKPLNMKKIKRNLSEADALSFKRKGGFPAKGKSGPDLAHTPEVKSWSHTNVKGKASAGTHTKKEGKTSTDKWGIPSGKNVRSKIKPADDVSKSAYDMAKGKFLQGLNPNKIDKISVEPKGLKKYPKHAFKYAGKTVNAVQSIFSPTKTQFNEGVFDGRVELRIGARKHVFESASTKGINSLVSGYANVDQPVDISFLPSIRECYLDKKFAQYMVDAAHYNTLSLNESVNSSYKKAAIRLKKLLESEYNSRSHEDRQKWLSKTIPTVMKQAAKSFRDLYESSLSTYDVSVKFKSNNGDVGSFDVIAKGLTEEHAAVIAAEKVSEEVSPQDTLYSVIVEATKFTPKDMTQYYAQTPVFLSESMQVDGKRLGIVDTSKVGIGKVTTGGTIKHADKPQRAKPLRSIKPEGGEVNKAGTKKTFSNFEAGGNDDWHKKPVNKREFPKAKKVMENVLKLGAFMNNSLSGKTCTIVSEGKSPRNGRVWASMSRKVNQAQTPLQMQKVGIELAKLMESTGSSVTVKDRKTVKTYLDKVITLHPKGYKLIS